MDGITTQDEITQLEELEKHLTNAPAASSELETPPAPSTDAKPDGDRAPSGEPPPTTDTPPPSPDTPATTDKTEVDKAKAEAEAEGKELALDDKGLPKRDDKGKFVKQDKPKDKASKFAADAARRDTSWKALDTEKKTFRDEVTRQKAELQTAIEKFNADVAEHRKSQTPEAYDQMALKEAAKQRDLMKAVAEAETAGDFDKSEQLKAEAAVAARFENMAKAKADDLRKNPPPSVKQQQEQFTANQREWILKAATDFPEYGKKGSELQSATAEVFKSLTTQEPEASRLPGLVYYCVRMAAAETAAARVPVMEKELGELRAKVKELDAATNPVPGTGVSRLSGKKTFKEMSVAEQKESLQAEAASMPY